MARIAKSPGKLKRRQKLLEYKTNMKKRKNEEELLPTSIESDQSPSISNESIPNIPLHETPESDSILVSINSNSFIPTPSEISQNLLTPKRPKIVKNRERQSQCESVNELPNSILKEQMTQNRNLLKQIEELKKRIMELERQRDQWKLKFFQKPKTSKITSCKQLSPLDDTLFCTKFNLSTKKRRQMKAYLREKKINLFAKNEEVRKLELVKDIASNFEYNETTVTDKNEKEKIIHSYIARDPLSLIVTYLTYLDNYKKLKAINGRLRFGFSGDDGRGWTKICGIPLDVPLSSSRDNALVLAIFNAKDSYENLLRFCKALFDLINNILTVEINGTIYELEVFAIGDMCFLCALFGHAGHSAKYPCLMCYIMKGHLDQNGRPRTWEEMIANFEKEEFSQKHLPLLKCKVQNIVPSVLHIPLGIGSDGLKILEKLEISIGKTGSIKAILSKYNLSRHPQTKQLNGNDMRKLLTNSKIFVDLRKIYQNTTNEDTADIVIDTLSTLGLIQGMMAIKNFNERQNSNLKNLIQRFKSLYIASPLNFTPKGHWLIFHGPQFVDQHGIWGSASEHGQEAIHGPTDDDMHKYRSLPVKKKMELVVRNCFLRNLVFAKSTVNF